MLWLIVLYDSCLFFLFLFFYRRFCKCDGLSQPVNFELYSLAHVLKPREKRSFQGFRGVFLFCFFRTLRLAAPRIKTQPGMHVFYVFVMMKFFQELASNGLYSQWGCELSFGFSRPIMSSLWRPSGFQPQRPGPTRQWDGGFEPGQSVPEQLQPSLQQPVTASRRADGDAVGTTAVWWARVLDYSVCLLIVHL